RTAHLWVYVCTRLLQAANKTFKTTCDGSDGVICGLRGPPAPWMALRSPHGWVYGASAKPAGHPFAGLYYATSNNIALNKNQQTYPRNHHSPKQIQHQPMTGHLRDCDSAGGKNYGVGRRGNRQHKSAAGAEVGGNHQQSRVPMG